MSASGLGQQGIGLAHGYLRSIAILCRNYLRPLWQAADAKTNFDDQSRIVSSVPEAEVPKKQTRAFFLPSTTSVYCNESEVPVRAG